MSRKKKTVKVEAVGFEQAAFEILSEYQDEVTFDMQTMTEKIGKDTARAVSNYIVQSGIGGNKYKNSIQVRLNRGRLLASATIYSPKHYRLTHLLENGHAWVVHGKKLAKEYPAHEHWAKAEKEAIEAMEKGIKKVVGG